MQSIDLMLQAFAPPRPASALIITESPIADVRTFLAGIGANYEIVPPVSANLDNFFTAVLQSLKICVVQTPNGGGDVNVGDVDNATWVALGCRLRESILVKVPDLARMKRDYAFWQLLDCVYRTVEDGRIQDPPFLDLLSLMLGWPFRVFRDPRGPSPCTRDVYRNDVPRCPSIYVWRQDGYAGGVSPRALPVLCVTESDLDRVDFVDLVSTWILSRSHETFQDRTHVSWSDVLAAGLHSVEPLPEAAGIRDMVLTLPRDLIRDLHGCQVAWYERATAMASVGIRTAGWFDGTTTLGTATRERQGGSVVRGAATPGGRHPSAPALQEEDRDVAMLVATSADRSLLARPATGMAMPTVPLPGLLQEFVSETASQVSGNHSPDAPRTTMMAPIGLQTPVIPSGSQAHGNVPQSSNALRTELLAQRGPSLGTDIAGTVVGNSVTGNAVNSAPSLLNILSPNSGRTLAAAPSSQAAANADSLGTTADPRPSDPTVVEASLVPDQSQTPPPSAPPSSFRAGQAAPALNDKLIMRAEEPFPTWQEDSPSAYFEFRKALRHYAHKYGQPDLHACISDAVCFSLRAKLHRAKIWTEVSDLRSKMADHTDFFDTVATVAYPEHLRTADTGRLDEMHCGPLPTNLSDRNPFPRFFKDFMEMARTENLSPIDQLSAFHQSFKKYNKDYHKVLQKKIDALPKNLTAEQKYESIYAEAEDHFAVNSVAVEALRKREAEQQISNSKKFRKSGSGAKAPTPSPSSTPAPAKPPTTNIAAVKGKMSRAQKRKQKQEEK
jgi:hypothetical protein